MNLVEHLKNVFGKLDTIPTDKVIEIGNLLDQATTEELKEIVNHRVKFIWSMAQRRLKKRSLS